MTTTAQYTTESPFLERLKERKAKREDREKKTSAKKTKPKSRPKSARKIRSPKKTYKRKKTASARLRDKIQQEQDESSEDEDVPCGVCGVIYGTDDKVWIQCSECELWFHTSCVNIDEGSIPDVFMCPDCES